MKIAFISYEYPPDTSVGGIATYTYQIAHLMQSRGHQVEVFAGSNYRTGCILDKDVWIHRVICRNRRDFTDKVSPVFANRHSQTCFDLIESPEIGAESCKIKNQFPEIPLIIKLHTPSFLVQRVNYVPPTWEMQLRWVVGAVRQGQRPSLLSQRTYCAEKDLERTQTLKADVVTTPSRSLGTLLIREWNLDPSRVQVVPNPYLPSSSLLNIPVISDFKRITFVGRLEVRKGVLELADAIPKVLNSHPDISFRFVGASWPSPKPSTSMQQYLIKRLWRYREKLEFTGACPVEKIPQVLAETDICVFPSRWENFPNVCLEAMAAGRGIVASNAGGMDDMLAAGGAGCLIPPKDPLAIASAICSLIENPSLRMKLGRAARARVLTEYNSNRVGILQEAIYEMAIATDMKVRRT